MREIISIAADWPLEPIRPAFDAYCTNYKAKGFNGFTVEKKSENTVFLQHGSQKKAKFLGAMASEYNANVELALNALPKQIIIDYDEGSVMKVGRVGVKRRKSFWSSFADGLREVFGQSYQKLIKSA